MSTSRTSLSEVITATANGTLLIRSTKRTSIVSWEYRVRDNVVRKLRGKKCRTVAGLMDEMGAALQFFYDFGENWNALTEVLKYMDEWLPTETGYVLVFERAEQLLADTDQDQDLEHLLVVLQRAADWFSEPVSGNPPYDRGRLMFHIILESCDDQFSQRIEQFDRPITYLPA